MGVRRRYAAGGSAPRGASGLHRGCSSTGPDYLSAADPPATYRHLLDFALWGEGLEGLGGSTRAGRRGEVSLVRSSGDFWFSLSSLCCVLCSVDLLAGGSQDRRRPGFRGHPPGTSGFLFPFCCGSFEATLLAGGEGVLGRGPSFHFIPVPSPTATHQPPDWRDADAQHIAHSRIMRRG